jgi:GTP cyclohydrolase I
MHPTAVDEGTPVSVKIRERIAASRKRFNANDNIAQFIEPGELELLLDEVEEKMKGVLSSLVIDTENDHNTSSTARRVAKMYLNEVFRGRYVPAPNITEFPNAEHLNELMIVGPITVRSACSHHFCPVIGQIWIGVMPNEHSHFCMSWRGVKDMDSKMINSVMRGVFLKDANLRREFLSLIPKKG